ncbi:pre-mRNA cleavage complex 2 Pcf11-like protein [Wolffia australiana]
MEMESTRRSLDRSKEPGLLKKPRLGDLAERDPRGVLVAKGAGPDRERAFPSRVAGPELAPSRFRANDPRVDDQPSAVLRGSPYQPQNPPEQQMQELAAQYKAALAELTFNSKPIITNLTIIAGENMPAAKPIAAVICAHILEVPSDQKLPSLYLLDSIVKNIGRDYIKHFASRLPEVFCKAYRQVDSSIHQGMRHLFGTWKGVFPPAPLLTIEKELSFQSNVNGSSSGVVASRPDSQAQRPPHSIHVNPKYLEARQQLQQPGRVKAASVGKGASIIEGVEKADRVPVIGSSRLWPDPSIKAAQRSQRELPNESSLGSISDQGSLDRVFTSDYSRVSNFGIQRSGAVFADQEVGEKPGLNVRKLNTHETVLAERTSSDGENLKASESSQILFHSSSREEMSSKMSSLIGSQNWKNSEEEEYTWDLGNSSNAWNYEDSESLPGLQKDRRTASDVDSLQGPWSRLESLPRVGRLPSKDDRLLKSREQMELISTTSLQGESRQSSSREHSADNLPRGVSFDNRAPGLWSSHETRVPPLGSLAGTSRNISIQEGIFSNKPRSSQLPVEVDSLSFPKTTGGRQLGGMRPDLTVDTVSSSVLKLSKPPLIFPKPSNSADLDQLEPEKPMQFPSQPVPQKLLTQVPQLESGSSFQQLQRHPRSSIKTEETLISSSTVNSTAASLDKSSTSKLLDAIAKSGLLPFASSTGTQVGLIGSLPLVSRPHPAPIASLPGSEAELPPLPPGPRPSSSKPSAEETGSNLPLSSLLSSLVAKGLISSGKELASGNVPELISDAGSSLPPASTSFTVSLASSSQNEPPPRVPGGPSSAPKDSSVSSKRRISSLDVGGLIGLDFRPDVLREYHLEVLNRLYDLDLQHIDAVIDEPRFKNGDEIQAHFSFNWFFTSKLDFEVDSDQESSRKWYPSLDQYISRDEDSTSITALENAPVGILAKSDDRCEPMVPADEGQCICAMCGEPFEDAFCEERDEWMYRGAMYCHFTQHPNEEETAGLAQKHGLIVHARCRSSEGDLNGANADDPYDGFDRAAVKMEQDAS